MYLCSLLDGHGTSSSPSLERRADRVQAGDEVAVLAELLEDRAAHAGHDPHRDGDVGGVGELDADLGDRRPERAHGVRHHVHRAAAHRALEEAAERRAHLRRVLPVVRRAGVLLALGADERAVLDAGDIVRVRAREVGVRALGVREALEGPVVDQDLAEVVVLLRGSVAPVDAVRHRQPRHLLDPGQQPFVLRRDRDVARHFWCQLLNDRRIGRGCTSCYEESLYVSGDPLCRVREAGGHCTRAEAAGCIARRRWLAASRRRANSVRPRRPARTRRRSRPRGSARPSGRPSRRRARAPGRRAPARRAARA